jgi:hypothetical protein
MILFYLAYNHSYNISITNALTSSNSIQSNTTYSFNWYHRKSIAPIPPSVPSAPSKITSWLACVARILIFPCIYGTNCSPRPSSRLTYSAFHALIPNCMPMPRSLASTPTIPRPFLHPAHTYGFTKKRTFAHSRHHMQSTHGTLGPLFHTTAVTALTSGPLRPSSFGHC